MSVQTVESPAPACSQGAPAPRRPLPRPRVACFSVHAAAEPGIMPRVMELFAKRGLVPTRWMSDVTGPGGRELSIDIQVEGLTLELGDYIARCLRQIHGVKTVLTSEKQRG